jgi:hypothetical protein
VLRGVRSGSDAAGDTRQQVRQGEGGPIAGDDGGGCAAKGGVGGGSALQRGHGAVVGGRARVRGARVSGGVNDLDICGVWLPESLPLCMVITPFVLFSCLL